MRLAGFWQQRDHSVANHAAAAAAASAAASCRWLPIEAVNQPFSQSASHCWRIYNILKLLPKLKRKLGSCHRQCNAILIALMMKLNQHFNRTNWQSGYAIHELKHTHTRTNAHSCFVHICWIVAKLCGMIGLWWRTKLGVRDVLSKLANCKRSQKVSDIIDGTAKNLW